MTRYQCPHCEKVFTRLSSLRNHTKIHEHVEIDRILREISIEVEEAINVEHVESPETNNDVISETSDDEQEIEVFNNEQEALNGNRERLEDDDKEEKEDEEDILSEEEREVFEEGRDENHLQVS